MSAFIGIIGGLIGGLIAAIPWMILSVYFNVIASVAAIPIALGVLYGYHLFGGKDDEKLPYIIAISSITIICFVTLVIIPLWVFTKEYGFFDFAFLSWIYEEPSTRYAILKDLVLAIVFTIIGIVGVVRSSNAQVNGDSNHNGMEYLGPYGGSALAEKDRMLRAKMKEFFASKNAMDKNHLLYKSDLGEIDIDKDLKGAFRMLQLQQIIRKKSGGYYYSERAEANVFLRFIILFSKMMAVITLVVVVIIFVALFLL
jgi:hypothetical protein